MRSFIYLDEYKLFSFSSQLFKGLVDHIVQISARGREQDEQSSEASRVVAKIAAENTTVSEKKFLHDYAYDLFESELAARSALLQVDGSSRLIDFEQPCFVKVSGPAVVYDSIALHTIIDKFNELVDALAYVTSDATQERAEAVNMIKGVKDRNTKEKMKQTMSKLSPRAIAAKSGVRQDDTLMEQLSILMNYGFGDRLHLHIPFDITEDQLLFTAALRRTALREPEPLILQKYSRTTDRSLVLVGVPTQAGGTVAAPVPGDAGTLRAALSTLLSHLTVVEEAFTGRMSKEVVIDPIAIYTQWEIPPQSSGNQ